MTRDETKKLLMQVELLYPEAKILQGDVSMLLDLWAEALTDERYDEVHACLVRYFQTDEKGFPPKVGQLLVLKPDRSASQQSRRYIDLGAWTE